MPAKDYEFYPAAVSGRVYLTKRTKSKEVMSQDRRLVTDNEIIGIFECYLRRYCEENYVDTVMIKDDKGKPIFTATLNDKER